MGRLVVTNLALAAEVFGRKIVVSRLVTRLAWIQVYHSNEVIYMLTNIVKSASGTAGELMENRAYDKMLKTYGEGVTRTLLEQELVEAGETWESFQTYRRVKTKIQNDQISIARASNQAAALTRSALGDMIADS